MIEKRLRDQSTQIKGQVDQLEELLAIKDAILDEYDELIEKIDKKNYPMIADINTKIVQLQIHISQELLQVVGVILPVS